MNGDPIVIGRERVAQIASFIGIAALIVGVIGFIWQGEVTIYVGVAFVVAIIGIAAWAVLTSQEFIGFITGRQMRRSTGAVFGTLLLVGITVWSTCCFSRHAHTGHDSRLPLHTQFGDHVGAPARHPPDTDHGFYSPKALSTRQVDDEFSNSTQPRRTA